MTTVELYNKLIDEDYFTEDELYLVTDINGFSIETLNDCIYARYGYQDYEQLFGIEEDEYKGEEDEEEE